MAEEAQERAAIRRIALTLWPKGQIGEGTTFVSVDELETTGTLVPRICDEITNRTNEMWRESTCPRRGYRAPRKDEKKLEKPPPSRLAEERRNVEKVYEEPESQADDSDDEKEERAS